MHLPLVQVYSDIAHFVAGHFWSDLVVVVEADKPEPAPLSTTIRYMNAAAAFVSFMALGHFVIIFAANKRKVCCVRVMFCAADAKMKMEKI